MPARLVRDSYGKSDVRVTRVIRHGRQHELVEMSVDVELRGDFKDTYLIGDNRKIVATDSMKNTVYVFAKNHPLDSIESFAISLADHFTGTYRQVESATVRVRQSSWKRIKVKARPHPHAFISGGNELRTCSAERAGRRRIVSGGLTNLLVLKTTDSAFRDFVRDGYTTLKDADDRIFATSVTAEWNYTKPNGDFNAAFGTIRSALLETFARHKSLSVQQTLYAMGEAALKRCKAIRDIGIRMPNKHRILVDLKPFGLKNDNDVFVWTDEPYGNIFGYLERS